MGGGGGWGGGGGGGGGGGVVWQSSREPILPILFLTRRHMNNVLIHVVSALAPLGIEILGKVCL